MTAKQVFEQDYRKEYKENNDLIAPSMVAKLHNLLTAKRHTVWNS